MSRCRRCGRSAHRARSCTSAGRRPCAAAARPARRRRRRSRRSWRRGRAAAWRWLRRPCATHRAAGELLVRFPQFLLGPRLQCPPGRTGQTSRPFVASRRQTAVEFLGSGGIQLHDHRQDLDRGVRQEPAPALVEVDAVEHRGRGVLGLVQLGEHRRPGCGASARREKRAHPPRRAGVISLAGRKKRERAELAGSGRPRERRGRRRRLLAQGRCAPRAVIRDQEWRASRTISRASCGVRPSSVDIAAY